MLKVAAALPNEPYREYKDVERVYSGSTEIDKILDKNGNVLFAVNKEVEGTPALTYKGKEETNLKNYRIYGQTVDGESVGDRTGNLFDSNINVISGYLSDEGILKPAKEARQITFDYIPIISGTYTFTYTVPAPYELWFGVCTYDESRTFQSRLVSEYSGAATFTIPDTTKYIRISLRGYNKTPIIMLNEGSTALPYEPFGYKVPVTVEGKNLLQNTATSQTINGVTFTVNDDGSITCNGTAEQTIFLSINNYIRIEGNVILSGCPDGGGSDSYMLRINSSGTITTRDQGSGANAINPRGMVEIRIVSGYTCNNVTFYPMIRKADIEDDTYEPYHARITTPIYLPEPIKMVGDEAEYIDYGEQKQHRVRKNLANNKHTGTPVDYTITENDNYIHAVGTNTTSNIQAIVLSNRVDLEAGEYDLVNNSSVTINVDYYDENGIAQHFHVPSNSIKTFTYPSNVTRALNVYGAISAGNSIDAYFQVMIVKHGNDTTIYEPYIENVDLDVTLPALPVLPGTNTLTVGTEVQPSNVYLKGRIKEVS